MLDFGWWWYKKIVIAQSLEVAWELRYTSIIVLNIYMKQNSN